MPNHPILDPADARLTADERAGMHAEMRAFMAAHPVRQRAPFFGPRLVRLAVPVAAVVIVFGGSAYAAELSLPNDSLYPVKVDVIEPALSSLAFTSAQEAQVNGLLVERRLKETRELVRQERLDTATASDLRARTERHADAAQEAIRAMAAEGDASGALEIGSDLEATIDGHLEAIAAVAEDHPSPDAEAYVETVGTEGDETEDLNDASVGLLATEPDAENREYAFEAQEAAREAIASLDGSLEAPVEDEDARRRVGELLGWARDAYLKAGKLLEAGDSDGAAVAYQEATGAATRGSILVESAAAQEAQAE